MANSRRMAQHKPSPRTSSAGVSEAVRVRMLGSFSVSLGARTIEEGEWRLRKAAGLVKLLALEPGHRMHRERLMDVLWPELGNRAAANNLRHILHVARRVFDPDPSAASHYLKFHGDQLSLCPSEQLQVDVEAFEETAATARRSQDPAAYRAAIELYGGELLPEDRYEEWTQGRREELRQLYVRLLVRLARLYEGREEYEPAIEALRRVLSEEPAREEVHTSLMRVYALSNQRHEAILQYEQLRKSLSQELDAKPAAESRRLYEEILAGSFPGSPLPCGGGILEEPVDSSARHNLPASLTSFIGREREMVEAKRLLSMTRLLTLTGAGGSGKTRLALEVARGLVSTYPDGVRLVELASLSDPALVPQAIATTLEVRKEPNRPLKDTLTDHLRTKDLLLVVDNCEHLVDTVARLAEALLRACPKLRVLATSRESLSVWGEVVWQVPLLSLPDAGGGSSVESLMRYEAVRLFVDRARLRLPNFQLTEGTAGAAVRVCRKLEGIPLAIELATARMGALAVEQVAERLDQSLDVLSGGSRTAEPRQQTLRATLDWSHKLLSEAEQALFRRLSVFAGGWTLEAAEAVGAGNGIEQDNVLDLLGGLVGKSLVMIETSPAPGGALRYRMLEPVRQYALERLEESGDTEQARERHARYYLELGEAAEPELVGARPVTCLERLDLEQGNLRAALSWSLDADEKPGERAEIGLRLAAALGRFWDAQRPGEGRRWLEKGLERCSASPTSVRAKALNEAGLIAIYELDPKGMVLLEEALTIYEELGDRSGMALSIANLGHAVLHLGDRERTMSLRAEVEALLSEPLERRATAHLLLFLAFAAGSEMDLEQMKVRLEEALALYREVGDIRNVATCLPSIGMLLLIQGDSERAAPLFEEGLLLQRELKYKVVVYFSLMGMAGVAALRGQPARAARLLGASEALREDIGLSITPVANAYYDYESYVGAARAGLSEEAFNTIWSEGRTMSPEQVVEYALSAEDTSPRAVPEPHVHVAAPGSLTPREEEIALLIARGLTNRQIASELSVSKHTVANHVAKILRKLGLSSRSQITTWTMEQRPPP